MSASCGLSAEPCSSVCHKEKLCRAALRRAGPPLCGADGQTSDNYSA